MALSGHWHIHCKSIRKNAHKRYYIAVRMPSRKVFRRRKVADNWRKWWKRSSRTEEGIEENLSSWLKEILVCSLTYLDIANRHIVLSSIICLNRVKDLLDAQWDQSQLVLVRIASHGKRLTWTCLAIGEHCLVYAVQGVMNEFLNLLVEDSLSRHFWAKNLVIREHLFCPSV